MAKQFAHLLHAPDGQFAVAFADVQLIVGDSPDVADRIVRRLNDAARDYAQRYDHQSEEVA